MVNKKYKDRLFCLLFGNEEYKDNVLSLYNALCHTSHTNTEDIQIYTIDDVIYIKMKNDVSILLDSFLYLWEQQSTFNPNMPIRGFTILAVHSKSPLQSGLIKESESFNCINPGCSSTPLYNT